MTSDNNEENGGRLAKFPWTRPGVPLSDNNLALWFGARAGVSFCHSAPRRMWRRFDGVRWAEDAKKEVEAEVANFLAEDILPVARKPKDRAHIGATSTMLAVVRRLQSVLAIDESVFDADWWLYNCLPGTLDLRHIDQGLRKHNSGDYISKMSAADPSGECPQWLAFIDWVCCDDHALASYLQRLAGYCLTGDTSEQQFWFLHGDGSNGKSVFLKTLLYVMGDYGISCPTSVWIEQRFEQHPEQIMRLRGRRLIVSSEIKPDAEWNIERLQAVTGGETIVARGMREASVEFEFSGKLLIAGNLKPQLSNVNDAIRRRLRLIPFNAHIAKEDADKSLADKFKREANGILKWMVDGCAMWQRDGLRPPKAVEVATEEYLASEDHVRSWIDEECVLDRQAAKFADADMLNTPAMIARRDEFSTKIGDLHKSWDAWARRNHVVPGKINTLSTKLSKMRFADERESGDGPRKHPQWQVVRKNTGITRGRVFIGIRLKGNDDRDEWPRGQNDGPPPTRDSGPDADLMRLLDDVHASQSPEVKAAQAWNSACTVLQGTCEHCGRTDGNLLLIRGPGVKGHVLHEGCAMAFFGKE